MGTICIIKESKDRRMRHAAAELSKSGVDVIFERGKSLYRRSEGTAGSAETEVPPETVFTAGGVYTLYAPGVMVANPPALAADKTAVHYFDDEEYELKNALLTAEAALAIIIGECDVSVYRSDFLITGYGRIGKFIAAYIRALGGNVTVYARRSEVRALASGFGYAVTGGLDDTADLAVLGKYDAVINTVPARIFGGTHLAALKPDCLFLELASVTSYDEEQAERAGIHTIWARGLPGQYSPVTAGRLIAEAALRVIKREHHD